MKKYWIYVLQYLIINRMNYLIIYALVNEFQFENNLPLFS